MGDHSLQAYDDSQYERPNQPWDCGHACEGVRCLLGPSAGGGCQADHECAPLNKNGKWVCSRSPRNGGRCDDGPVGQLCSRPIMKCSPVASIRRKRGAFVVWCCTATLGLTLLALGASWRDQIIKPGDLSNQHALIIKNTNEHQRCAACHAAAELGGLDQWTRMTFSGTDAHPHSASQSERCLVCHHDKIGDGVTALLPHGLPSAELATRTLESAAGKGLPSPRETSLVGVHEGQVACAACHREHQGAQHDLTTMSNASCAECHQANFRNLATGHPEFGDWPYSRRTRIAFDHAMHQGRYFPEGKQEFACRNCHDSKSEDGIVGVVSYEAACQSCHGQKIQQSYGEGISLVSLPMLDLRALKAEGLSVGDWPELANGDFDGALPPLTRLLLDSDSNARISMEQFGTDFEFADVDPDNLDDLEAAVDIAWGIKRIVHDLTTGGPSAMRTRLEKTLDRSLTDEELRELLGQLTRESAAGLQQAWFPNLPEEVANIEARKPLPLIDQGTRVAKNEANTRDTANGSRTSTEMAGWQRDDETFSFRFRPQGHADRFMTSWLDVVSSSSLVGTSEAVKEAMKQLSTPTSAGLCVTCHSVDATATNRFQIHWHAQETFASQDAVRASQRFTHFSHDPHIILPELNECTSCHDVNTDVTTSGDYLQTDPHQFQSGFRPMSKQSCASCHAPKLAGDQCTTCHQYHVGSGAHGNSTGMPEHP